MQWNAVWVFFSPKRLVIRNLSRLSRENEIFFAFAAQKFGESKFISYFCIHEAKNDETR